MAVWYWLTGKYTDRTGNTIHAAVGPVLTGKPVKRTGMKNGLTKVP